MPFADLVCGAKRKASESDDNSEVKMMKKEVTGAKMADRAEDGENVEDWGREADKEMQRKKLTVKLPNTWSRLSRPRQQVFEGAPPLEEKPTFKRKFRTIQQKAKPEATKDAKAKEPKAERKAVGGGKRSEMTEEEEAKEERTMEERMRGGGGTETEEDARKMEGGEKAKGTMDRGKEKVARAKPTRKMKFEVGEKPLKRRGKAGGRKEDETLAVPVALLAAASIKEPDMVTVEPYCQEVPCQTSQVSVPVTSMAVVGQLHHATEREEATDLARDDNGCLSLHMLSHSMQRGSKDDQLYCLQYANDIMAYLKSLEAKYVIPADFSPPIHPQTNRCMRATLIDWLVQVQEHQGLLEDSLHLCVAMIDVYLSRYRATFSQFQLVGVTCLFIASKYEERFPPTVKSLIKLTDNSYIYDEVISMEMRVLKALDYQLSIPTALLFLHWYLWRLNYNDSDKELTEMLCTYILTLTLLKSTFSKFSASLKSSAVILLSRELLALPARDNRAVASARSHTKVGVVSVRPDMWVWDDYCVRVTGYQLRDLKICSVLMVKELKSAKTMKFQGPQEKFNQPQYRSVSSHPALSPAALNELAVLLDRLPES